MKITRNVGHETVQFSKDQLHQTIMEIELTEREIEEIYTEFLDRKFVRDVKYFLEENYDGKFDEEIIESIASDYKEALGDRVGTLESEVFDDVMELNYPEYERNW